MLLRRIHAPTLAQAMQKTHEECGSDALVVETKRQGNGYVIVAARPEVQAPPVEVEVEIPRAPTRWTQGFRELAERAQRFGLSVPVLRAIENALLGTRVRLDRPGDPALPDVARRILGAVIRTTQLELPAAKIMALVGTTGVGKTTTLAKLAARATHAAREQVAIATLDTYRLAAVEQLRAYADLLQVPCEVVFTPQDLRRFIATHAGKDRIFIDTSGRAPRDTDALAKLAATLRTAGASSLLCLPATARRQDALATLDAFEPLAPTGIALTKWDETEQPGEALSVAIEQGIPLSHITIGQDVPDDILDACADSLAACALQSDPHPAPTTP